MSYTDHNGNFVIPKESGIGVKVDPTAPDFGWKDLLGVVNTRTGGATVPQFNLYRTGIYQYQFQDTNDELYNEYHIPHDYVPNSPLYIHVHWSNNVAGTTGSAIWTFDVSYAKGYNQAAFSAVVSPTATQAASTTQYQHMIAEVQLSSLTPTGTQLNSGIIEVDGLLLVRTRCTTMPANNPFIHYIDIHYQSTQMATKGRNYPNFYI